MDSLRLANPLSLGDGEVRVWSVSLEAPKAVEREYFDLLSTDERARAERFRFEGGRRRYAVARGALRVLLGAYLGAPPRNLRFRYGEKGKPALEWPSELRFNLSHSAEMALYAFTMDCEIGVDIERIRPVPEIEGIARRFFAPEEAAEVMETPPEDRTEAFFRCWTSKESYIKAIGDGLSMPLDRFRVTVRAGDPPRVTAIAGDPALGPWSLQRLTPAPGYVGALAYPGPPRPAVVEASQRSKDILLKYRYTLET